MKESLLSPFWKFHFDSSFKRIPCSQRLLNKVGKGGFLLTSLRIPTFLDRQTDKMTHFSILDLNKDCINMFSNVCTVITFILSFLLIYYGKNKEKKMLFDSVYVKCYSRLYSRLCLDCARKKKYLYYTWSYLINKCFKKFPRKRILHHCIFLFATGASHAVRVSKNVKVHFIRSIPIQRF